jgi:hypothetical protein
MTVLGHSSHSPYCLGRIIRAAQKRFMPLAKYFSLDNLEIFIFVERYVPVSKKYLFFMINNTQTKYKENFR